MISLEFWVIIAIVAIICELISLSFFLLSIGLGAIAAAILNYYNYDPIQQLIAFIIVTIIFVVLSRPLSRKLTKNSSSKKANTDRFIGKVGIAIEDITPEKSGRIKIYGEEWRAVSDDEIHKEDEVKVVAVSGVKLIIEKIN